MQFLQFYLQETHDPIVVLAYLFINIKNFQKKNVPEGQDKMPIIFSVFYNK